MSQKYIPGKYSASAEGMSKVEVSLTVDQDKIREVRINVPGESKDFGQAAAKELEKQLLAAQSAEIDGVSGASLTTKAVKIATKEALQDAKGKKHKMDFSLDDGTFTGKSSGHGGPLKVEVSTKNNQIKSVKVVNNSESLDIATDVLTIIPKEIVDQQTLGVDAITGVTLTSRAIINATEDAMEKAKADIISWQQKPYKNPNLFKATDFHTNLLIIGGGMAGLATAAFALKNKVKDVILIEKNSRVGGSLRYATGGFVAANSTVMHQNKYDDSLQRVMDWVRQDNNGRTRNYIDESFVEYLLSETGKTLDQMLQMTDSKVEWVIPDPYLHVVWARNGADTAQRLEKYIRQHGGRIIVDTELKDICSKDNVATKAIFENKSGKFSVSADNIVVTTGGTSFNHKQLMERFTPGISKVDIHNEANHANSGEGYAALIKIGAIPDGEDVYKNGFVMMGNTYDLALMPNLYEKAILINKSGKRFTNEKPFDYGNITAEMFKEVSSAYYLIFDTDLLDPKFKNLLDSNPNSFRKVQKSKSLADLARKINLNPEVLIDTVKSYNRICDNKRDPFGKDADSLVKYSGKNGFYAVYVRPGSWGTMGGVRINKNMQVLTKDGHFENLFTAGETATGDLFTEYYMGAFSLGYYSTEGRLNCRRSFSKRR